MTAATPPTFALTTVDAISAVDEGEWDRLPRSFYSSHRWLTFAESHGDCAPRHLLVRRDGELIAALPSYEFPADVPPYYDPARLLGYPDDRASDRPLQILGARQGYAAEVLVAPWLDPAERSAAIALLLDTARAGAAPMTAMLYLDDTAAGEVAAATGPADRFALIDGRARLSGIEGGLDGYRDSISANARNRLRKEQRKFTDAGCRGEVLRLSDCAAELGALSATVLQRYGHDITAAEESSRFARQADLFDEQCLIFVARRAGTIVGFTQFFRWRDELVGRVHGLDDDLGRAAALYYNLTYYLPITYAGEHGITSLDLGCDSYEAKVRRGARLEPLWGAFLDHGDRPWSPADHQRAAEFAGWDASFRALHPRSGLPIEGENDDRR